jgi:uncharacterized protein involved in exopolysaccharide biosynthesis
MTDSFDPIEYLSYLRRRAHFAALAVGVALAGAAAAAWLLPNEYTASATLVIEPPAASDPRAATAVSPIYLESLKTYEQFASGDSLFARACAEFGLLKEPGAPPMETFKRRVLVVTKPKDTKLLRIEVTLRDAGLAHRVAEFLARETVALSRSIALEADNAQLEDTRGQLRGIGARLQQARAEYDRLTAGGNEQLWNEAMLMLADLTARTRAELLEAQARAAELEVRGGGLELEATRARVSELNAALARLDGEMKQTAAKLADLKAGQERAAAALRLEEQAFELWSKRASDQASISGTRSEQLRVVDPGIVPQRPSFPSFPLFLAAAFLLSSLASLAFLSLRFGFERRRAEPRAEPMDIRVGRSANR